MPYEYRLYYQQHVEGDSQLTPVTVRNSDTASKHPTATTGHQAEKVPLFSSVKSIGCVSNPLCAPVDIKRTRPSRRIVV